MRLIAAAAMLVVATGCLASEPDYELSLDVSINGEAVASPHVVVTNGVKSTIDLEGRFIDVVASETPRGILVSFWIGELDGSVRKLLATPSGVTRPGRRLELKVIVDDQASDMREVLLGVVARQHAR